MKRLDLIIIIGVLIISIVFLLFPNFSPKMSNQLTAVIRIKSTTYEENFTIEDDFAKSYAFDQGTIVIEFRNGQVRAREMDKTICPEGICSKTGWIDQFYQTIICLPNKISINLVNSVQTEKIQLDAISN